MKLSVVPTKPIGYCAAWHCQMPSVEPMHGARCCFCNRDVAAPESVRGMHVGCIYCGMANGDIPEIEIEPCRGPENGLHMAGVDYNKEPYGRHVTVIQMGDFAAL